MSHSQRMKDLLEKAITLYDLKGVHPAAEIMPFMGEEEFTSLVEDADSNGFQNAVKVTDEGLLIDGRNRICASIVLEKDVHIEVFNPSDPIQYVLSENLERRHLSSQQKAMIAVDAEDLYALFAEQAKERQKEAGGDKTLPGSTDNSIAVGEKIHEAANQCSTTFSSIGCNVGGLNPVKPQERRTDTKIAKAFGTNQNYVAKAKKVKEHAPELASDVKAGKLDLNDAAKEAKQRAKDIKGQMQEAPKPSSIKPDINNFTARKVDGQVTIVPKSSSEPTDGQSSASLPADIEKIAQQAANEAILAPIAAETKQGIETVEINGYKLHIWHDGAAKPTFNTANESIDWAWSTWNPVTGCLHGCSYCYAAKIAVNERMANVYPKGFDPVFHPYRLDAPRNSRHFSDQDIAKKAGDRRLDLEQAKLWAKNVFVCSMADLFGKWVPEDWIMQVFDSVIKYDEWNYLFLTKYPQRLQEIGEKLGGSFPNNCWVGTTVDEQKRVRIAQDAFANIKAPVKWLSLEPLLTNLEFTDLGMFDMVAIGGQTDGPTIVNNPQWEWVENILWQARESGTKVYFKENLIARPKELPSPKYFPEPEEEEF